MKKTALVLLAALTLAGCEASDPDGEGATIVDTPTAVDTTSEPAAEETPADEEPTENAQGTRSNPLPIGTTAHIGDWNVTVTDVELDATETVKAENQFNDDPVEGRQFVLVGVEATYVGEDSGTFWVDMTYQFVGSGGNTFGSGEKDYCGSIPDSLQDEGETFPDATVSGNLCFSVPSDQIEGGAVAMESTFSFDGDRVFFAVE